MTTPTEAQIAWLAGIIEGEGCLHMSRPKNKAPDAKLTVSMTDEDVILQMQEWFGGNVNGPHSTPSGKNKWCWNMGSQKPLYELLQMIRPWMKSRRTQKIEEVLSFLESKPSLAENGVYVRTDEFKRKISESHKGRQYSEKARQNMSEGAKRRWSK